MSFEIYLGMFGCISLLTIASAFVITYLGLKKEYEQTVKLDITADQMQMLEKRLSDFFRENQLEKSAGIDEISDVLKVTIGGENSDLSSQADFSDLDESGSRKVMFKKGLTLEKKNFAYAHECAHLINGDMAPYTRPEGHNKALVEQLADYTAAAMLMPKDEIYEYLEYKAYKDLPLKKRVAVICSLCRRYKVSEIIALRRVKEVCKLKQL